jgi:hypothetical protein
VSDGRFDARRARRTVLHHAHGASLDHRLDAMLRRQVPHRRGVAHAERRHARVRPLRRRRRVDGDRGDPRRRQHVLRGLAEIRHDGVPDPRHLRGEEEPVCVPRAQRYETRRWSVNFSADDTYTVPARGWSYTQHRSLFHRISCARGCAFIHLDVCLSSGPRRCPLTLLSVATQSTSAQESP